LKISNNRHLLLHIDRFVLKGRHCKTLILKHILTWHRWSLANSWVRISWCWLDNSFLLCLLFHHHFLSLGIWHIGITLLHRWIITKCFVTLNSSHVLLKLIRLDPLLRIHKSSIRSETVLTGKHIFLNPILLSPSSGWIFNWCAEACALYRSHWHLIIVNIRSRLLWLPYVHVLVCSDHLIDSIDLILHVFTLAVFPFLLVQQVRPLSLQLYQAIPQILILTPKTFQILLHKLLRFRLERCLPPRLVNFQLHVPDLNFLVVAPFLKVFYEAFKLKSLIFILI
jgi:hypothetical protein